MNSFKILSLVVTSESITTFAITIRKTKDRLPPVENRFVLIADACILLIEETTRLLNCYQSVALKYNIQLLMVVHKFPDAPFWFYCSMFGWALDKSVDALV